MTARERDVWRRVRRGELIELTGGGRAFGMAGWDGMIYGVQAPGEEAIYFASATETARAALCLENLMGEEAGNAAGR